MNSTNLPMADPDLLNRVSAERLMKDVEQIARWVRLSGTPEERAAFQYLETRLQEAGLQTRWFEHEALISLPGSASLFVERPIQATISCITHSFAASTPEDGIAAPATYLRDSSAPPDLTGQIAVIDGLAMPGVVQRLEAAGAAGAVFLNRDPLVHEMIVSTVWGSPTLDRIAQLPTIPVVSTAGEAATQLRQIFQNPPTGIHLRLVTQVDTRWRPIPLLIGDLPGRMEDTFILLAGHVDSWHYGAMDNGSANATMLEVARLLAQTQPRRGLRVAFWSGHSHGRYAGSTWYADTHWLELNDRCVAHVNVDSVGGKGATRLDSGYCMPETKALGARAVATVTGQTFQGTRVGRAGDQSFLGIGIPSLFMSLSEQPKDSPNASLDFAITESGSGGLGWWWHTTEDTVDKIDPDFLVRDTQVYLAAVYELCTAPVLPLDYQATATELHQQLQQLQNGLADRFDLSDCLTETAALQNGLQQLEQRMARIVAQNDEAAAREVNQVLRDLGRLLIPVLYTQSGRFDHDPATAIPPLPPLVAAEQLAAVDPTSDQAYALITLARRGRNRLLYALATARRMVEKVAQG